MKLQRLFIFAMMIFAALAVMTNGAAAQKKQSPNANRNWMVFNTYQTVTEERSASAAKFSCQSPGVYATAKFTMPVDLSDGFYVTLATAGEVIIQHKMTLEVAPPQIRSILVDLVPDGDADLGFPDATLDYSRKLLTELNPGVHKIVVAVSVGEGSDEQIAAGEFTFDNRRGCEDRYSRVENLISGGNETPEQIEPTDENTDIDVDSQRRPRLPQDEQPIQPTDVFNYILFYNNCSQSQAVTWRDGGGGTETFTLAPGYEQRLNVQVGTNFWNGGKAQGKPFYVLPASRYTDEYDKSRTMSKIPLCQ